jgi:hypothetical protein
MRNVPSYQAPEAERGAGDGRTEEVGEVEVPYTIKSIQINYFPVLKGLLHEVEFGFERHASYRSIIFRKKNLWCCKFLKIEALEKFWTTRRTK